MKKKIAILTSIFISLFCVCMIYTVKCSASVEKYIIETNHQLTMKKGTKIKFVCNEEWKSKRWKSTNKKIIKVNKKGKVTAFKKGKATIKVTNGEGKALTCKVTVKKNIVEATEKNVTLKVVDVHDEAASFVVSNNTDESIELLHISMNCASDEARITIKDPYLTGIPPYICVPPKSKYKGSYSFSNYEITPGQYKLKYTVAKSTYPFRMLNFALCGSFLVP